MSSSIQTLLDQRADCATLLSAVGAHKLAPAMGTTEWIQAVSAVVKLPFRIPPFAGVMGSNSTQSVAAIATQAATSGIVAVTPVGDVTCPLQ